MRGIENSGKLRSKHRRILFCFFVIKTARRRLSDWKEYRSSRRENCAGNLSRNLVDEKDRLAFTQRDAVKLRLPIYFGRFLHDEEERQRSDDASNDVANISLFPAVPGRKYSRTPRKVSSDCAKRVRHERASVTHPRTKVTLLSRRRAWETWSEVYATSLATACIFTRRGNATRRR